MDELAKDLRYALRALARSPGFTAVALLTLVLGIGANSAIFSAIDAVLLQPLPYAEPARIVRLSSAYALKDLPSLDASDGEFYDYRQQARSFAEVAAYISRNVNLTGDGEPERVRTTYPSVSLFAVLGVGAAHGRVFTAEEDTPAGAPVALLGDGLWHRRFAGDPGVLGKSIVANGQSFTVVGVMPPGFDFPEGTEIWSALSLDPANPAPRGQRYLKLIARLKPGVSLAAAQAEADTIAHGFPERFPTQYFQDSGWGVTLTSLLDETVGKARPALLVLLATVGLVLLIACVNVANLLLARAQTRGREVSIRVALGAGRGRLLRQSLTEGVLLALLGGGLGLLLAHWATRAFLAANPDPIPRAAEIGLDGRVVAFTLGLSVLTGVVLGLVPAFQAARPDLQASLKEGGKATSGAGQNRFRRLLAGLEVAMALLLLIGAGLMVKSFAQLRRVDPGFRAERLLTLEIALARAQFGDDRQVAQFYDRALDRLGALPGIESASAVSLLPLHGESERSASVSAEGRSYSMGETLPEVDVRFADHRYFRTMGIPLLRGRSFAPADDDKAVPAAVVDETVARRLWPGEDALGKRLKVGPPLSENPNPWRTVVGIAKDVRQIDLTTEPRGTYYLPQLQSPERIQYLVLRTQSADPLAMAGAVRAEILAMNKDQPVADVKSMEQRLASTVSGARFAMVLLAAFAVVAATLAAVGIYGVVAYSVTQRTHEIGLRMALGARRGDVLRLVVGQGMAVVAAGVVCGLLAAFALTRLMASLLYGVAATDAAIFTGVPLLLLAVALAANLFPAWRATRVEPTVALRYE